MADAYDAIRSDRPYRAGRSHELACEEIAATSGSHFDPRVVNAFMSIPKEDWDVIGRCAQIEDRADELIDRREISSFILSLQSLEGVTSKLKALCA